MAVEVLDNSKTKQFDFEKRGQRSIKQGFQTNPRIEPVKKNVKDLRFNWVNSELIKLVYY